VQYALADAGDHATSFLWRRLCRDLDGPFGAVVVAKDASLSARLVADLKGEPPVSVLPLHDADGEGLSLGALDRMLGTHALVWATPIGAALGTEERATLAKLVESGCPRLRAVVLADEDVLARLSDEPEKEAGEVLARVRTLLDDGWAVLRVAEVADWLLEAAEDLSAVVADRKAAVAGVLLDDARARADKQVATAAASLDEVVSMLAQEDEVLDAARADGRRTAGHVLGAMRRHTEQLLVDTRGYLLTLESDLPAQIEAVGDLVLARRTLAHWLHHVVQDWMRDRLADWRAAVIVDLAEVHVGEDDARRAELLLPALHPSPIRNDAPWGPRLTATAALGGGVALAVMGAWIPGALVVTSGVAWSALGHSARKAANQRRLTESAVAAVREMGGEAERVLRAQITQIEDELARLGDERAEDVGAERQEKRAELEADAAKRRTEVAEAKALRATLAEHMAIISPDELEERAL
jgi:hypothetical protein